MVIQEEAMNLSGSSAKWTTVRKRKKNKIKLNHSNDFLHSRIALLEKMCAELKWELGKSIDINKKLKKHNKLLEEQKKDISFNEMCKRHNKLNKSNNDIEYLLMDFFLLLIMPFAKDAIIMGTSIGIFLKKNGLDIHRNILFNKYDVRDIDIIIRSLLEYNNIVRKSKDLFGNAAVNGSSQSSYGPSLLNQSGISTVRKMTINIHKIQIPDCCSPFFTMVKKLISSNIKILQYDFIIPIILDSPSGWGLDPILPLTLFNYQQNCTVTRMAYCHANGKNYNLHVSEQFSKLPSGPVKYSPGIFSLLRCIYTSLKVFGFENGLNKYGEITKYIEFPSKDDPKYKNFFVGDMKFRELALWDLIKQYMDFITFDTSITFNSVCIACDLISHDGIKDMILKSNSPFFNDCKSNNKKLDKYLRSLLRNSKVESALIKETFTEEISEHGCLLNSCIYCQSPIKESAPIIMLPCGHIFHAYCFLGSFLKDYLIPMLQTKILNFSSTDVVSTAGKCPLCRDCNLVCWNNLNKKLNRELNYFWREIEKDNPRKSLLTDMFEITGQQFSPLFTFGETNFAKQIISINNRGLSLYKKKLSE